MMQTLKNKIVESENPVGVKRVSNWKLPPDGFAYGKKEVEDKEGVDISNLFLKIKLVTRSWKVHEQTKRKTPPQDFVKINKLAVQKDNVGRV